MCGLLGLVAKRNKIIHYKSYLDNALDTLTHRGPDQSGVYYNEKVYLGHKRLSIIDLDSGEQPMISSDGRYIIVFNGEIFNFEKIKNSLKNKGYFFKTNSDTEVILSAYNYFGHECLKYFNGMFSIAIWDSLKRELFLARDRFGIKPLFYAKQSDTIIFSSEIKAIYKTGLLNFKPKYDNFNEFLVFGYISGEETMHYNINELEPAHYLIWSDKIFTKKQYWNLKPEKILLDYNLDDASKKLINAVDTWLTSDVEVGSLLSGGVDSNVLAMIASKKLKNITTFGGILEHDPENNEENLINIALKKLKGDHYSIKIKNKFLENNFFKLIDHFDDPIHDSNYFSLMAICDEIKKYTNYKVVICGEGADEIFGGYERYIKFSKQYEKNSFDNLIYSYNHVAIPRLKLITQDPVIISRRRYEIFNEIRSDDIFNTLLYYDQRTFLGSYLHRQDRVGMMYGLEIRTPYLDHHLANYINSITSKKKYNSKYQKLILRLIGEKIIDNRIIWDNQKIAFSFPISKLLKNGFLYFQFKRLFKNGFLIEEIYNLNGISKLLHEHSKGIDHSNTLWRILCLEYWLQSMKNKHC